MKRGHRLKGRSRRGKYFFWGCLLAVILSACGGRTNWASQVDPTTVAAPTPSASVSTQAPSLTYQTYDLPQSQVHVVKVPAGSQHRVAVAVAADLAPLPELAEAADAIAAINAGFFDPQNGLTTSYVTVQNALVADPQQNPRLMENPDLSPYLEAILDRSEFRIYDCSGAVAYDIVRHSAPTQADCTLTGAVGAGPQLLPTMTGYEEGFLANNEQGELVRDALGSQSPNARSAVGLLADGTVVLAIATRLSDSSAPSGLNLQEFANFLQSLGVEQALNLDGGSSTGLVFQGQSYFGQFDPEGLPIVRPIKSILYVR